MQATSATARASLTARARYNTYTHTSAYVRALHVHIRQHTSEPYIYTYVSMRQSATARASFTASARYAVYLLY